MPYSKTIIKELALNGKLITSADPALIGNNFQTYKNLRYAENAPEGVLGMTKINPDVLMNSEHGIGGFHFKKDQPAESHVMFQTYSSLTGYYRIRQNKTVIPNEGNFDATSLWLDSEGRGEGIFSYAPNGQMAYCNGKDSTIWAGDEVRVARFINYKESDATMKYDFTELVDNNDSTKYATLINDTANCYIYLGFTRIPDKVKLYIGTGNVNAATMALHAWDGTAWTVHTVTDGTSSGGCTLSQTGTLNFSTVSASSFCPRTINGIYLYWIRLTTSALISATTIYYCTVNYEFQTIKDIWDGEYRSSLAFYVHKTSYQDYSINIHEDSYDSTNNATFAVIGGLTTAQYLVVGYPEKQTALEVHLTSSGSNSTASTELIFKYWNGTAWTAPEWVEDGTSEGGVSFAKSGVIQWKPPAVNLEHKKEIAGRGSKKGKKKRGASGSVSNLPLYYYQISFADTTLSTDTSIYYIGGIPAPKSLTYNYIGRYAFPVFAKERLWLGCDTDKEKNKAICSMRNSPDVWNGEDTTEFFFGDDSALTCGCSLYSRLGSSIYNVVLFYKANAIYGITGNTPDDFVQYEISSTIGCVAPRTLKTTTLSITGNSKPITIWQGSNGIYIFDNTSPELISGDISDIFDKSSPTYINPNKLANSVAFMDENKKEYHWLFASGTSTTLNKEFVYNLNKNTWFEIDRGTGKYLQFGFEVSNTYGNTYCYGGADEGYMQRLENGTTFDGNALVHTLKTGDIAPNNGSIMYESQLLRHKIIMKSKTSTANNLTINHYGDGSTTGTALTSASPIKAGYRITDVMDNLNLGNHIFHALEYIMTTNDESKGFAPLFIGMKFNILGEDLS